MPAGDKAGLSGLSGVGMSSDAYHMLRPAAGASAQMPKTLGFILVMSALGLPGVGLFAVGAYQAVNLQRFLSAAQETTGQVIALTHIRSDDDGSTYNLVVDYPVPGSAPRRLTVETRNPDFTAGQALPVLYTTDPPEGRVAGIRTTWGQPITFLAVGAAWAGFAAFILTIALRHNRPS